MTKVWLGILACLLLAASGWIGVRETQFRQTKTELTAELTKTQGELAKAKALATMARMAWNRYSGPYNKETLDGLQLAIEGVKPVEFVSSPDGKRVAARIPIGEMALYYQSLEGSNHLSFEKDMGQPILPYRLENGTLMFPSHNTRPPPPSAP